MQSWRNEVRGKKTCLLHSWEKEWNKFEGKKNQAIAMFKLCTPWFELGAKTIQTAMFMARDSQWFTVK